MASIDPVQARAFVAACGFLASAGFFRFVVRKPSPARAKRRPSNRRD